jgi:hypothetical protein
VTLDSDYLTKLGVIDNLSTWTTMVRAEIDGAGKRA